MYKDSKLQELYESVLKDKLGEYGYDIWDDQPLTEIKIEYFFDRLFQKDILFELFSNNGEVKVVYENKPIKGGLEFKLENSINNVNFYTIIVAYKADFIAHKLEYDIMDILRLGNNVEKINELKKILDNNKDKYVIAFRFEDESQLIKLTGKMQNKAATVFSNVYRNIRYVTHGKRLLNDVIAYYCMVSKNETKRIELYKKIMKSTTNLQNIYEDYASNKDYIILYFW